jgi:lipopolysaccharide transport system permease protein
MNKLNISLQDYKEALKSYRVWLYLGLMEVKQRYRRSILGPWWITLSMLIFVSAMSVVFSKVLNQNIRDYVPFFTSSFLIWMLISNSINEATFLFKSNSGFIKQTRLPYNLYVFKHLTRQFFIFMHNFVVYLLVVALFQVKLSWVFLLVFPGLLLVMINLYWVSLLIGMVSSRFCDMIPIINSCVQIIFFITPISWMPKLLGADSLIIKFNPLVYFLEIVRSPLLNTLPSFQAWTITIAISLIGLVSSLLIFSNFRSRIAFWMD